MLTCTLLLKESCYFVFYLIACIQCFIVMDWFHMCWLSCSWIFSKYDKFSLPVPLKQFQLLCYKGTNIYISVQRPEIC